MRKRNKLVQGVGVNDANYEVYVTATVNGKQKNVWTCPFYRTWLNMITRCYCEAYLSKRPSYRGSKVCDEWLKFSNFRAWMVEQDWKDEKGTKKHLDKDLLAGSNRGKVYSPETCLFVDLTLNAFLNFEKSFNSGLPVGVYWCKLYEMYRAQVNNPFTSNYERLGFFATPEAASAAYCARKKEIATQLAATVTDIRLKQILLDFEVPEHLRTAQQTGANNA